MKPMQHDHYSYRAIWSEEDREHVEMGVEFPSLSWFAYSPEKALAGIREFVCGVIKDMKSSVRSFLNQLLQNTVVANLLFECRRKSIGDLQWKLQNQG